MSSALALSEGANASHQLRAGLGASNPKYVRLHFLRRSTRYAQKKSHPPSGDKLSATQTALAALNASTAMGFKCDVCEAQEGSVFCFGDNAVMCEQCDVRCGSGAWLTG